MGCGAIVSIEDLKFLTADERGWTLMCAGVRWCAIEHFALLSRTGPTACSTNIEFSVCGE
ncbi:hypothetical protein E5S67_01529 [Microcoleus sp. IPMA8]|uniref:Uncharacterized protein n=1 Tax=Microcoleus asticus IPMA8 TaxID=2563858 RepID=A0ABX2CW27_9CYAN|nr:hypothetical protein [Microcoleus asticus IPMA8]